MLNVSPVQNTFEYSEQVFINNYKGSYRQYLKLKIFIIYIYGNTLFKQKQKLGFLY